MTIQLTQKESENYFHSALCNGLNYFRGYDLSLSYSGADYKKAKDVLSKKIETVCFEDVLLQILIDGGALDVIDEGYEGSYSSSITLKDVHNRVSKTDSRFLIQMDQGNDDADTADCILQTVFFEEVIFG